MAHLAARPLTPVEFQVVDLVADGLSNREIAERLFSTVPTVKSQLARITARFPGRDRAGLVGCMYLTGRFVRRPLPEDAPVPRVTRRQHDVLAGIARGWPNAEIAGRLGISENTVKCHVVLLLRVFAGRNRAHLVRLAVDAGVLRLVPAEAGAR